MENEIWADAFGFEDHYEVSNHGNIRSKAVFIPHDGNWNEDLGGYIKHKKLHKVQINRYGYVTKKLCKYGGCKRTLVHRLVARAFIPTDDYKQQINHIDGNKQNNHVSNLEWCSPSFNIKHAWATGLMTNEHTIGSKHHKAKINEADVLVIRDSYKNKVKTKKELAAEYGLSEASVSDVLYKRTWRHVE